MSTEPDFNELVRFVEGDLTVSRAKELEAQPGHAERVAEVTNLIARLAEPTPELADVDLVPQLHARLDAPRPPRARPWPVVLALAASVLLAVTLSWRAWTDDDGFRPKGGAAEAGRWAGVELHRVIDGGTVRVTQSLRVHDALAFAYRNAGERPFSYLMVFAVDARGEVFWFHPAWTDAAQTPRAISIEATAAPVELREAVQHDFVPGPLVVHALFSREPLTVREVEAQLGALEQDPRVFDQRLPLVVEP